MCNYFLFREKPISKRATCLLRPIVYNLRAKDYNWIRLMKKMYAILTLLLLSTTLAFSLTREERSERRASELPVCLEATNTIETLYGTFVVEDDLFWELLKSPAMQRLKDVHQYGISNIVDDHVIQYSRFDHSVGVWAVLRLYGASRQEQIAGLLHDISHTVFSHTCDYLFKNSSDLDAYQDDIHSWYLKQMGIESILNSHGVSLEEVLPKSGAHKALEQQLPELCADRIDYNIQEALMIGYLTKEEVPKLLATLKLENGSWYFTNQEYARKLAETALYGTINQWGGPGCYVQNTKTATALRYALKQEILCFNDIHFSSDKVVWEKLRSASDPELQELISDLINYKDGFKLDPKGKTVRTKLRAINPWVMAHDGSLRRLSEVDATYFQHYQSTKELVSQGWSITF